jgi:hypothetical protein
MRRRVLALTLLAGCGPAPAHTRELALDPDVEWLALEAEDFDGDGDDDLLALGLGPAGQTTAFLRNRGDAEFDAPLDAGMSGHSL